MGGRSSRRKGHDFEREIADVYRKRWPRATVRRSLQAHSPFEPDVVIEGDAPNLVLSLWTECQASAAPTPLEKLLQAERDVDRWAVKRGGDATSRLPVVVWRKTGARMTHATLRASTLLYLHGKCSIGPSMVTMAFDDLLSILPKPAGEG